MSAKSQCASIAQFLARPGARLTSLDALRMFGCSRLAARILDLRRAGMSIVTRIISVIGANGVSRIAEYYLAAMPKREGT